MNITAKKTNPFETHSMLATRNALYIDQSSQQYVQIDASNIDFDITANTWGFSICILFKSINPFVSVILSRRTQGLPTGGGYYLVGEPISATQANLYFATNSTAVCQSKKYVVNVNQWYRFSAFVQTKGSVTTIYSKLNDRSTTQNQYGGQAAFSSLTANLDIGRNVPFVGGDTNFDGLISNLIFFNALVSDADLSLLHYSNVPPASVHDKIIAHYPLNQSYGGKVYDVVEQYNYAKALPLSAKHGDLKNYPISNPILQNTWQNFYESRAKNSNFLKLNGVDGYGEIPTLAGHNPSENFIFAVHLVPGEVLNPGEYRAIFSNRDNTVSTANFFQLYWDFSGPNNTTAIGQYTNALFNASFVSTYQIPKREAGRECITFIFVAYTYAGNYYRKIFIQSRNGLSVTEQNTAFAPGQFNYPWANFLFGNDRNVPGRFGVDGLAKAVMIENYNANLVPSNPDTIPDETILALLRMSRNDDYKRSPNILFDIDFSQVFQNVGAWYAKDTSGLNNDCKLFNFDPAVDMPANRDLVTGLPIPDKALRLVAANQHYLSVPNFNPSNEKGYTYIIGFALNANRNFSNEYLLAKRQNSNNIAKLLLGNGSKVLGWFNYHPPHTDIGTGNNSFLNYDMSKPLYYCCTELATDVKSYPFGFFQVNTETFPLGFDEVDNGALFIGSDDQEAFLGNGTVDGYLSFVGIWKGILSKRQILDVVNNTMGVKGDVQLMNNCQLYLMFDSIYNNGGTYQIRDWSPQNRDVILHNYSLAEITSGDPSCRLVNIDTLR